MDKVVKFIKKNYIIILIFLFLIVCSSCFIVAYLRNKNSTVSNSNSSASILGSSLNNIDYCQDKDLEVEEIISGGSYNITGEYSCISVNTSENVELKLNNASITCNGAPGINVIAAENVSIVLTGENNIDSTTTEDLDGAIYSRSDLIFSGDGILNIKSNYDGIVSKDTLLVNSGTFNIESDDDGIRGKDKVVIVNGVFNIISSSDAIKASNDEDSSMGYIVIDNGTFNLKTIGNSSISSTKGIKAVTAIEINGGSYTLNTSDDAIHSNSNVSISGGEFSITSRDDGIYGDGLVEISGGTFDISASEGIEGTYVKINDGTINISASDDGINAANKSSNYSVKVEINGGYIIIKMGQGDTDGIDSNGDLIINGGVVDITCNSPFDYDGKSEYNGGELIVNGEKTSTITNQFMGGQDGPGGRR